MGQVRWAWPEIQAAQAAGHTLHSIHKRLNEGGIEIDYRTLSLYIGRLERQEARRRPPIVVAPPQAGKTTSSGTPPVAVLATGADLFANIRREREKKRNQGFTYHPFSTNKDLLE
jgi:hypothetical protein